MQKVSISRSGNSDAIRIPSSIIMKQYDLSTGDELLFQDKTDERIILKIKKKNEADNLPGAGILHEYSKGNPDFEAERNAVKRTAIEKYTLYKEN